MPTSAAGSKRQAGDGSIAYRGFGERGFTLIELMVVVAIIGIASAVVVWALPDPRGRLADEALRLAGRAQAVRDTAIVTASPVSLWIAPTGYGFDERTGGVWRAMDGNAFRVTQFGAGTTAVVAGARERIVYDSTGLPDHPARIVLARDGERAGVLIAADGSASIAR